MQDHTTHDPSVKLCECGCGQPTPLAINNNKARGWLKGQGIAFVHGHNRRRSIRDRFWNKVDKSNADGCWKWMSSRHPSGHGDVHVDGRTMLAHRLSYELHYGPIPDGLEVCHRCDNPPCVRPDHLFLGTHALNMHDMVSKNRQGRGSSHSQAKLNEAQVSEIRRRYAEGSYTYKTLANEYQVGAAAVSAIVTRKTWPHVP